MFSVIFPGQGSQIIGMGKEFFEKYKDQLEDRHGLIRTKSKNENPTIMCIIILHYLMYCIDQFYQHWLWNIVRLDNFTFQVEPNPEVE